MNYVDARPVGDPCIQGVAHTQVFEKEKRKTERTKQGGSVDQLTSLKSNLTSLE